MPTPNPDTLRLAATDLRAQAGWLNSAVSTYREASSPQNLVWEGPGRHHLGAYQKPFIDRLQDMRRHLITAAERLEQAEKDLALRIRQLRIDEENVRTNLRGYFERNNLDVSGIGQYVRSLPPSGDPAWADHARNVVGHSETGRRR